MSQPPKSAKDIFQAALDTEPTERAAFLDVACSGDAALRRHVEALLRVHDEPDSLLDSPRIDLGLSDNDGTPNPGPTIAQPVAEKPGTVIGPYKLLQQIGEGGFGVVYMAEQTAPVERRVALKIIKPGMDTRQVIARFEAEEQALAMMDHPNIAKVLDAGTTESGRPYFVMELVKGIPITKYCDQWHLTPKERLALFIPVCQAVQHAHQKGIIHLDWEWYYLMSRCRPEVRTLVKPGYHPFAAWSPDGELIGAPGAVWHADTGEQIRRFDPSRIATGRCAWSPDGQKLAWGMFSDDKAVYIWDRPTDELSRIAVHNRNAAPHPNVESVAFSPDGSQLASGSGGSITVWNVATRTELLALTHDRGMTRSLAWSPDGKLLAAAR